jgi:hypothetical protein
LEEEEEEEARSRMAPYSARPDEPILWASDGCVRRIHETCLEYGDMPFHHEINPVLQCMEIQIKCSPDGTVLIFTPQMSYAPDGPHLLVELRRAPKEPTKFRI